MLDYALIQLRPCVRRHAQQHIPPRARDVRNVPVPCQRLHNRLRRLDLPQRHKRLPSLVQGPRNRVGGLCLTLCPDDRRVSFLFGLR